MRVGCVECSEMGCGCRQGLVHGYMRTGGLHEGEEAVAGGLIEDDEEDGDVDEERGGHGQAADVVVQGQVVVQHEVPVAAFKCRGVRMTLFG